MLFEIERWATVVFFGLICIGAFGGVALMIAAAWDDMMRALLGR